MADQTYINAPSATVTKKFSMSGSTKGGPAETQIPTPKVSQTGLSSESSPAIVTPEQIAKMYQPLLDEAKNEQPTAAQPMPAQLSPLGTFLGTLAANMATSLTDRPQFGLEAQRFLEQDRQRRQQIEDQNYANRLLYDKEHRNRLLSLRGQILSAQVDRAIQSGDLAAAEVATRNLARFQEGFRREEAATQQAGELTQIRVRGQEERKTQAQKFTLTEEEGRKATDKPLTAKEYTGAINDVNKNKNIAGDPGFIKEMTTKIGNFFTGKGFTIPEPTDRQSALETVYVTGLLGGEPNVRPTAWRSLRLSIRKRLGLPTTGTLNPAQRTQFETELTRYGLELGGLEP